MMSREPLSQETAKPSQHQKQQQHQQHQLQKLQPQTEKHKEPSCCCKCGNQANSGRRRSRAGVGGDALGGVGPNSWSSGAASSSSPLPTTTTSSWCYRQASGLLSGICWWLVLVVFMLILCGNSAVSQQLQQQQQTSYNLNNNGNQNNSSTDSNNNSANISWQIATPNNDNAAVVQPQPLTLEVGEGKQQPPADVVLPLRQARFFKFTTTTTTPSSALNGKSLNVTTIANGESGGKNRSTTSKSVTESLDLKDDSNDNNNDDNEDLDTNDDDDDDLGNSSELLNESEDGYEHSSVSPTTYRPTRPSVSPQLTAAQERERRLMDVLAARRNALHRPGFRNRIGTTGRTATAVETTSKSPTDPRSICIRNCTKNFTRRTTASCMRQCANFSRNGPTIIGGIGGGAESVVMVKNSSKKGTGTAQAGEKDTNEILFTDESSHGLLVIAKEQNDTANHITDEVKGIGAASKLRGRRKPGTMVTVATTSIEDDEIQPYLYFGQKLPPLKPNALTITSVSDEHPKLLEVSVAEEIPSSTTPVTVTSTLSAVERSRARFKYNPRGGVSFNRRYTTLHRGTTPEAPTEVKTTTLRIVTEKPLKVQSLKPKAEIVTEISVVKKVEPIVESIPREALREKEDSIVTATPLIITVLSDEEMMTPPISDIPSTESSTSATTERETPSTTSTTAPEPPITTTTTMAPITSTTTSTPAPRRYSEFIPKTSAKVTPTTISPIPTTTTTTTTTIMPTTTTSTTSTTTTTTLLPTTTNTKTTTSTSTTTTTTTTTETPTTTRKSDIIEENNELLRALGPSLVEQHDDDTNIIIFVNRTSGVYRGSLSPSSTTMRPFPQGFTTDSGVIRSSAGVPISGRSTENPPTKENPPIVNQPATSTTTRQPQVTGEISSSVVTDDQEISLEMHRMNIVTMVLAGIGIVPLLAIILYLLRNYLLKRPIKDDEDFDVCITDQQPISPVKKLDGKYQEEDEDVVDHHKKPPQRQHSLHSKLVAPPLARDANHNHAQQRYDDKSSVTSDQEFDRSNIRLKSLLGEGNFGQVWKAEADDLSGHFGATRIVAVKTIKACSTQLSLKEEGNIMRKLGSHQNVVTLLGACVETEPHMLIMEYAMRGRLLSLLRAARNATNILPASVPGGRSLAPLSPRTLAGFCLDIARGMEYIAEKRIVHRDLAARNVLLDHNGVCKICDFGMSIDLDAERKRKELEKNCANEIMRSNFNKFKFDFGGKFIMNHWTAAGGNGGSPHKDGGCSEKKGQDTIGKRPALPIRWMAPESLQYNCFSTETDIWAFGIVLWEIATLGSTPYSHLTGREVIRRVPQGLRPDLPKEGRHEFYNLMSRCWHKDPQMRPSFTQCRLEINRSLHKWVDDDSAASDYMDVSGFSEDLEQGMVYFNHRISEFECEI
ncbi:mucin-5AC-like [Musca domestica]|uniref:Mucin-5AC-like n=1 Tax=Musca domestica TaxID=7370 RepID=A0A1I8MX15_MUSDO|nr:mucin-5AC-like [Musca domestica]